MTAALRTASGREMVVEAQLSRCTVTLQPISVLTPRHMTRRPPSTMEQRLQRRPPSGPFASSFVLNPFG